MLHGRGTFALRRVEERWRISGTRFIAVHSTGNAYMIADIMRSAQA